MKLKLSILFWIPLICIAAAASSLARSDFEHRGHFYPNVYIGDEPVGGKTFEEVREKMGRVAADLNSKGIRVVFHGKEGAREINIPISAQGLTADLVVEYFSLNDWQSAAEKAYAWGRSGSVLTRAWENYWLLLGKKSFDFNNTVNEPAVRSFLEREIKIFLKEAEPAQFAAGANDIVILPEKTGERIDPEEIIRKISDNLKSLQTASLEFNVQPDIPTITEKDLAPFLKSVRQIARATTAYFSYGDYKKYVSGPNLAAWLTLKDKNAELLTIDKNKLENFLNNHIAPLINNPPQNSRFDIQNGKLVEITPGKSGNAVDLDGTERKINQIIRDVQQSPKLASLITQANFDKQSGIITIPVEILKMDPKITRETIARYGIENLVGSARTGFKGSSADRIHNIAIGVAKLNGILIAPNEEFSAVKAIGPTTKEEGFVEEYVIKDNKSIKEFGGGLCQIGTTLFRLALNAGLPITDRQNHRYVVSYYGPGLDATIYGPEPDLKFINDTGQYLLLQARVKNNEVILELYGQKDSRQVTISEPTLSDPIPAPPTKYALAPDLPLGTQKCSETPRAGVTAEVTYRVAYSPNDVREQVFKSIYQPWQKICLIGTQLN